MKKVIFISAFLAIISLPFPIEANVTETNDLTPIAFIENIFDEIDTIKEQKENQCPDENPQCLYELLGPSFLSVMDMEITAKLVLDKSRWDTLTEEQRNDFLKYFLSMLIETFGKKLLNYSNLEITEQISKEKYTMVSSTVKLNATEYNMVFSIIPKENGWKLFDLIINGTSIIKQLKYSYGIEIKEKGFQALLERLKILHNTYQ